MSDFIISLATFVLIVMLPLGWVMNAYKLVANNDFEAPIKPEVVRTIGLVIAPIGCVVGWINFDDEE